MVMASKESDAGFRQAHFMLSLNFIEEFQGCIDIKNRNPSFPNRKDGFSF